ncbi:MAG: zinc ribbon domain-containing protein [Oscillospiraceae bacterium]|jgi:uncharacterized membrane protein|nr:zinc ribbon domain-containing protein [Oscillospiraceae bacterium]
MPYCGNCGAYIEEGTNFCSVCGSKTENSSDSRQTAQQTIPRPTAEPYEASSNEPYSPEEIENSKIYATLAYLGILFFLPLVATPNSKYGRYHANQGLLLLIASAILGFASWLLHLIIGAIFHKELVYYGVSTGIRTLSGFGVFLSAIITIAVVAATVLLMVYGMLNAFNGKTKPLPVIGNFTLIQ